MNLGVQVDTKGVLKFLEVVHKKQVPFATSNALNATIFKVRKRIVGPTWNAAFDTKNGRFPSTLFKVRKASKRRLSASLFDRLGRASLDLHTTGGVKRPKGGSLAIPTSNIKRSATGKISKGKRPQGLKNSFVANLNGRGRAVWQRYGRKGSKIRMMYDLERSARISKRFRFYEDAEKVALKEYPKEWEKSFIKAVRSAR